MVALRPKIGRGGTQFQYGPHWGRGTHFAGVSVAILRARTNHIITAVTAVIRLMEQVETPGFVYDEDLHFLKIVGRWQICQGLRVGERKTTTLASPLPSGERGYEGEWTSWSIHSTWDIALDSSALVQHPVCGG